MTVAMLSTHGYFDPVPVLGQTDTGGQVVYVLELAKALVRQGIKVDIYTRWFDREQDQIDPVPGCPDVRIIRIPAGPWEFLPKEEIYDVLPELSSNMVDFIRDQGLDYDLFHGHYVDAGIVALDVAEALDRPAFFTAHSLGAWKRDQMGGDPEEMERKFKFKHRVAEELRIFRSVRAQTVTTTLQREKLEELYGFSADNVVVITPGVDVHGFQALEPGEPRGKTSLPEPYVLCISRVDTNKGHDLLLAAFDEVAKAVPDVHLVIGGGSPDPQERELDVRAMMKSIIDERGMQDRVRITGYVPDEDLVPYYQNARLFVLPSLFEPFGMTVLEAMACATPVVASRFGGIRTVIDSGVSGVLVDPSDATEFADAMIALLQDEPAAERIGLEGCRVILDQFSWEAIAGKFIACYEAYRTA